MPAHAATDAPDPTGEAPLTDARGRELGARGRQTRRRLLDAGNAVFSRRGYHAARVDDIVNAAKTSHGTFYLYFANKEDLFGALLGDLAAELTELGATLAPLRQGAAGRRELRQWLARFVELYARYGSILRTWTEAEVGRSELGRLGTDLLGELAATVADRIVTGDAGADDVVPQVAGLALVAMVERFCYFVSSDQVAVTADAQLDVLVEVVDASLFGRSART